MNQWQDRIIALAALVQTARLVQQVAREGRWDEPAARVLLGSVLQREAATAADIYAGARDLRLGFATLAAQLQDKRKRDPELLAYVVALLALERRYAQHAPAQRELVQRLDGMDFDAARVLEPDAVAALAEAYRATLSQLPPRILVNGDPAHIQDETNTQRIRALLLAGVRAAVLWQQKGGRRWRILFQQTKILQGALWWLRRLDAPAEDPAAPG